MSLDSQRRLAPLTLTALGVVYGDIGTSPLYAMRECFFGSHSVPPTQDNVLGVLSLIIYSLLVVISLKYVAIVMRADNHGEGGILALTALLPAKATSATRTSGLVLMGLFGAALLYGDGMITPAITVLGAVEGLNVATPVFTPYVVPLAVGILLGVFAIQRHGTERVGRFFGPVMLVWFLCLGGLGVRALVDHPVVLTSVDPRHAAAFFVEHGWHGFAVLGAVFLVVTGGEALYADMGHVGKAPHTSSDEIGQVYVPQVNWALMLCTIAIAIVIGFGSSSGLAAAYGIAVTLTMIVTAVLLHAIAIERWRWPAPVVFAITGLFLTIDVAFFGANVLKIAQGGWLPLVVGTVIFTLMTTWKTGRRVVADKLTARSEPLEDFMARIAEAPPARVLGTAVFMTAQPRGTPPALAHNLRYNKVLHEHVVTLIVKTLPWPHVPLDERVSMRPLGAGVYEVTLYFGFMEDANVPEALARAARDGLPLDADDTTYFLGRETLIASPAPGMAAWREHLFVLMARNAVRPTGFFRLPPERVVELGVQVEL